jgi:uncharacterized membrane protein
MNGSQIHLALTHVPVILSFVGLVLIVVGVVIKNPTVIKTSFYVFVFAGLLSIPVFLTGEQSEEVVENMPGVSKDIISTHESFATTSFVVLLGTAAFSILGLILYRRKTWINTIIPLVLLFSLASAGAMARTAHLGGQIRHTEIRPGAVVQDQHTDYQPGVNNRKGTEGD